jgi:hypothetical protein
MKGTIMKKLLTLVSVGLLSLCSVKAQIPTIDVSSLQQLVQQYQTMQQQLSTAKNILTTSSSILSTENTILSSALGQVTSGFTSSINGWLNSFTSLQSIWNNNANWFENQALAPIQNFDNNMNYWASQAGQSFSSPAQAQAFWTGTMNSVNAGTATINEQYAALAGYNARLVNNAQTSQQYGSNILASQAQVISNTASGTLIEQAAANNTLLYQQTAMMDKMKNDINDATVAEAADRDAKLKAAQAQMDRDNALNQGAY